MKEHTGHNEVRDGGVVHICSCGWVSRPCFSSAVASGEGMDHRDREARSDLTKHAREMSGWEVPGLDG